MFLRHFNAFLILSNLDAVQVVYSSADSVLLLDMEIFH